MAGPMGLIPAQSTVNFYDALVKDIGTRRAQDDVRLFMVPGMGHCAGGSGPSSVDYLGTIDKLGRNRQGTGAAHRQQPAAHAGAHAPAVRVSAGREIFGQRQHRRREELPLQDTLGTRLRRLR